MPAEEPTTASRPPAESDERYRALIENAYELIAEVNAQGEFLYVNPTVTEVTGYPADALVGKSVFEHVHEEDREHVVEIFGHAVEAGRPGRAIYRYRHRDGHWLWLESAGRPYVAPNGEPRGVIHSRDVSERVEAEHALREEESRHRALAESLDDLIVELDEAGRFLYVSPNVRQLSGHRPEDLLGRTPEVVTHPDDWPRLQTVIARGLLDGAPARIEYRVRRADGGWMWMEVAGRPFEVRNGQRHIAAVCRDVTVRKHAQQGTESLVLALDGAADAILVTDAAGTICFANTAFASLVRSPGSHLLGRNIAVLRETPLAERVEIPVDEAREVLVDHGHWTHTFEDRDREGRLVHYRATASGAVDAEGRVSHYILSVRDISREVELETELRQSQKLEALGTLAGGVAHDFNNLLTGVLGYASMLRTGLRQESEVREAAEVIESAALRGAELANRLLDFAGRAPHRSTRVDVHAVIRDVAKLLTRTIPRNVRLDQRLDAARAEVDGDRGQLQQVLLNLALNARDAMPRGGVLAFETALARPEVADAEADARELVVTVRDSGTGISNEVQARMFEPFFTTKGPGHGSGMGLAVVYGIVTRLGGSVSVQSCEGEGTEFRLSLPLAEERTLPATARASAVVRGTGRVLVADDEPAVRRVLSRMLESLGYAVVAVSNGLEAVDYYRTRGAALDLVIVDLDMPTMGGAECFHQLRQLDPDVRVLISTGLGPAGAVESLLAAGARGYLGKPYVAGELSDAVARALAPGDPETARDVRA